MPCSTNSPSQLVQHYKNTWSNLQLSELTKDGGMVYLACCDLIATWWLLEQWTLTFDSVLHTLREEDHGIDSSGDSRVVFLDKLSLFLCQGKGGKQRRKSRGINTKEAAIVRRKVKIKGQRLLIAFIVKHLAQEHKCHDQDSSLHPDDLTTRTWIWCS